MKTKLLTIALFSCFAFLCFVFFSCNKSNEVYQDELSTFNNPTQVASIVDTLSDGTLVYSVKLIPKGSIIPDGSYAKILVSGDNQVSPNKSGYYTQKGFVHSSNALNNVATKSGSSTVTGYVKDGHDDTPIPGASVIPGKDGRAGTSGTVTDVDGKYSLSNVQFGTGCEIEYAFIGYYPFLYLAERHQSVINVLLYPQ